MHSRVLPFVDVPAPDTNFTHAFWFSAERHNCCWHDQPGAPLTAQSYYILYQCILC